LEIFNREGTFTEYINTIADDNNNNNGQDEVIPPRDYLKHIIKDSNVGLTHVLFTILYHKLTNTGLSLAQI
jgi:hypothetical protein